jgi:hypothetical protein
MGDLLFVGRAKREIVPDASKCGDYRLVYKMSLE